MIALLFAAVALSRDVGTIGEYQIVEVDHVHEGSVVARSVLAGKSKAQLREFWRQDSHGGAFLPTAISQSANAGAYVTVGHRDVGSLMPMVKSHYFLQGSRFVALNLRQVSEAAEKALPKGHSMLAPTPGINSEATIFSVAMRPEGEIEVPIYIDTSRPGIVRAVLAGPAKVHLDDESPRLWTRWLTTMAGGGAGSFEPHSIRYYQPHPCLRKTARERIGQCYAPTPEDRQLWRAARSKLREVGTIGEFRVFELDYLVAGYDSPTQIRTVLVGRSLDVLYEVWARDFAFSPGHPLPTKIVMAGGTQPLITINFSDGGMYYINYESFFWLSPRGPMEVDFSAVVKAAEKAIPKTEALWQPATNYGIRQILFSVGTYLRSNGSRKTSCCHGTVEVPYTIEEGTAKPVAGKAVYRRP